MLERSGADARLYRLQCGVVEYSIVLLSNKKRRARMAHMYIIRRFIFQENEKYDDDDEEHEWTQVQTLFYLFLSVSKEGFMIGSHTVNSVLICSQGKRSPTL